MSGDILGLTDDSRALSASQLHLLLHPTEEEEDAVLRKSDKVRDTVLRGFMTFKLTNRVTNEVSLCYV